MPKKKTTDENGQYIGGRVKGKKNLKKTVNGGYINEHGVFFSEEEKKHLETLVNSANRKRKKMQKEFDELPFFIGGEDTGFKRGEIQSFMDKENDFVLHKKTKSLQRFRSKTDYEHYINSLEKVTDRGYISERVTLYKDNHIKALEKVFGDEAKDIIDQINKMPQEDYMRMVVMDETLEISYIGSSEDDTEFAEQYGYERDKQLTRIRNAMENVLTKKGTVRKRRRKKG